MKLSAGAFLAAFLAAFDALKLEVAPVTGLLTCRRPSLFEFLSPYLCALMLYVGDHGRDLLELRRVQSLQPLPRYPPRFHHFLHTNWVMYILPSNVSTSIHKKVVPFVRNTIDRYVSGPDSCG